MRHWHFYDEASGLFTTATFSSQNVKMLPANTPKGCKAIEGRFDHLSQRVDIETGEVVDYRPAAPSDDYEWNGEVRRWVLSPSAHAETVKDIAAREAITDAEVGSLRALRELLLDPSNAAARAKLQSVNDQIAARRSDIRHR